MLADRETNFGETVAVLCGILAALGLFTTWITVDGVTFSSSGTDHRLVISALVVTVIASTYYRPWKTRTAVVVAVSGFLILLLPTHLFDSILGEEGLGIAGHLLHALSLESGVLESGGVYEYHTGFYLTFFGGLGMTAVGLGTVLKREIVKSWRTELLGAVGAAAASFVLLDPDAGAFVYAVIWLGWIALPIVAYCDLRYVRANTAWNPRTRLWMIGFVLPIVHLLTSGLYLYKRPTTTSEPEPIDPA